MNLRFAIVTLLVLGLVAGCTGDKDNSEPPAALTKIDKEVSLILDWRTDTRAKANRAAYRLRPLLIGDRLYSIDTGGTITSIHPATGRRQWVFESELDAIAGLGGNLNYLIATSRNGDIRAYQTLDDGLELLWQTRIDSEIRATPVVDFDQVFVRSIDGKLRSLAAEDGMEQWVVSHRVPALSLTGNSEPLVQGDRVIAGFDDGKLIAFDRISGQVAWETTVSFPRGRTEVERLVDLDGRFVLRDGVIYAASFQGRLVAIQAVSGDLLWSRQFSSFQSIAIDQDAIYLSADNSHIWSIDRRTGSAFWKQDVLHARRITAPAILNDKLVVADLEGFQHWFLKADGKLIGRIRTTEGRSFVQPLIWENSVLTLDKFGLLSSVSQTQ